MTPDCRFVARVVEAAHWKRIPPRKLQGVVIHCTVNAPTTPAIAIAHDFATTTIEKSAHVVAGADEAIQCVPESGEPFAAPGTNATHYQIEIVAMPSMRWGQWVGAAQTQLAAAIIADVVARNGIPAVLADDVDGLLQDPRGITTHWHVTKAVRRAHALGLTSSPFYTIEHGHFDPFASTAGPSADVDQFDLLGFFGMILNELPAGYARDLSGGAP